MSSSLGGSFCGYPAAQVIQDFYLWERVLNENEQLGGIVELGTAYGGFSLFLATQARYRDMEFWTFDSIDHRRDPLDWLFGRPGKRPPAAPLGAAFRRAELVKNGVAREVEFCFHRGPVALFCDDGNKAEEVRLYAPALPRGSMCLVHDWGTEIGPQDIPGCLSERYGAFCDEIGSMTRVFAKVGA